MREIKLIIAFIAGCIIGWQGGNFFGIKTGRSQTVAAIKEHEAKRQVDDIKKTVIVHDTIVESKIVYRDRTKIIKEYVNVKKDYADTFDMPVMGLHGYIANLPNANAESTSDSFRVLTADESSADTSEQ